MKLKLTLEVGHEAKDVLVTADGLATVGDIADAVARGVPEANSAWSGTGLPTIRNMDISGGTAGSDLLRRELPVGESTIRSGSRISLAAEPAAGGGTSARPAIAVLRVHAGADQGREFQLSSGTAMIGRDAACDIVLADPFVSKRHLRISITDVIEAIDQGSANGTLINDERLQRSQVRAEDRIEVGDTILSVTPLARLEAVDGANTVAFNRPPIVPTAFVGEEVDAPEPPSRPRRTRFPYLALVAPLLMAPVMIGVMALAIPAPDGGFPIAAVIPMVAFLLLSPLIMVANFFDQRRQARKEVETEMAQFTATIRDVWADLTELREKESSSRLQENPSTAEIVAAADHHAALMWSRRTDLPGFLEVRLGLGSSPSRTTIKLPDKRRAQPEHWVMLKQLAQEFRSLTHAPIVGALSQSGGIGVAGSRKRMAGVARGLVAQLAGLHSPADLVLCTVGTTESAAEWDWLKWLPHVGSAQSPIAGPMLTDSHASGTRLVAQLEELVAERLDAQSSSSAEIALPRVVVLVLDGAPVDRPRLVGLAEDGPAVGVHVMWCAESLSQVPASCRAFLELSGHEGVAGLVHLGESVHPVQCEELALDSAVRFARRMAPVVDAGARVDDQSDLPRSVAFLSALGTDLAQGPEAIVERWRANDPRLAGSTQRRGKSISLRAVVGQGSAEPFGLDLRTHGPHALVGGTTGAGKSEFLQTWVLSLAASQSPDRVNFLFVDYKGGSAFARCTDLPHCVGLVTDLDRHLVRRALTSLRAELTFREHFLQRYRAKDLESLEKIPEADQLPSLVIVVDEFAALAQEMPEFVDGVIDVAQRGRSLGLHLILATQRPAGVIKGNLRANTNLRVSLRMADADDASDVIGTDLSAGFDPSMPGRAAAKVGPGRVSVFQSLYVGGSTPDVAPRPEIEIESLGFGVQGQLTAPTGDEPVVSAAEELPTDLSRVVDQVIMAHRTLNLAEPRRPWLPVLAPVYDLEMLPQRTDTELVLGVMDLPHQQTNVLTHFRPDIDGNIAIIGTGGSGKSTVLRTLAIAAAGTMRGGPCDVYALDFGSRGLAMLEELPHVGSVIAGSDHERVGRLLRWLRDEVDGRARRYAAARASTIAEYRSLAVQPDERRILVLLDGFGAFRQEYEVGPRIGYYNLLGQLAADGRAVGVHFAVSADRPGAIPASLAATIQRRLTLRLSDANDYALIGAPGDVLTNDCPPGRGLLDGMEVQIAVLGGSESLPKQAEAVSALAAALDSRGRLKARPIERLSGRIRLSELPVGDSMAMAIGISDDDLGPFRIEAAGSFLVAGPPGSGRTTAVATLVSAAAQTGAVAYLFAGRRSALLNLVPWVASAVTEDDVMSLAADLEGQISSRRLVASEDRPVVIAVEGFDAFSGTLAESSLERLMKLALDAGAFVVGDCETGALNQSYVLGGVFKQARRGIALQPDDVDGQAIFRTTFPRSSRSEFPVGRGVVVDGGRVARVQMCLPE